MKYEGVDIFSAVSMRMPNTVDVTLHLLVEWFQMF
jgi:hypothetical protein